MGKVTKEVSILPLLLRKVILLAIGIISILYDPAYGYFFLNLFFASIIKHVMILPHELGHGITAKLVGFNVPAITIGQGIVLFKITIFGIPVIFAHSCSGGLCHIIYRKCSWFRLKRWLIVFGGLFINVLICTMSFLWLKTTGITHTLLTGLSPVGWLFLANIWLLWLNALPFKIGSGLKQASTDGRLLLSIPFSSQEKINQLILASCIFETAKFLGEGQFEPALKSCNYGLNLDPKNALLKFYHGSIMIKRQCYSQALQSFREAQKNAHSLSDMTQALLLNNIALLNIYIDPENLLHEADSFSEQACVLLPNSPATSDTRSLVLLELKRIDEAKSLIYQSVLPYIKHSNAEIRAHCIAILGLIFYYKGSTNKAIGYRELAYFLDHTCPLIEKFDNAIRPLDTEF